MTIANMNCMSNAATAVEDPTTHAVISTKKCTCNCHAKNKQQQYGKRPGTTRRKKEEPTSAVNSSDPAAENKKPTLLTLLGIGRSRTPPPSSGGEEGTLRGSSNSMNLLDRDCDCCCHENNPTPAFKRSLTPPQSAYVSNHVVVNHERTRLGLEPLTRCAILDEMARSKAQQMAKEGRLLQAYSSPVLCENVIRGPSLPLLHQLIMHSNTPDNNVLRDHILDPNHLKFGMGTAKSPVDGQMYVSQLFQGGLMGSYSTGLHLEQDESVSNTKSRRRKEEMDMMNDSTRKHQNTSRLANQEEEDDDDDNQEEEEESVPIGTNRLAQLPSSLASPCLSLSSSSSSSSWSSLPSAPQPTQPLTLPKPKPQQGPKAQSLQKSTTTTTREASSPPPQPQPSPREVSPPKPQRLPPRQNPTSPQRNHARPQPLMVTPHTGKKNPTTRIVPKIEIHVDPELLKGRAHRKQPKGAPAKPSRSGHSRHGGAGKHDHGPPHKVEQQKQQEQQ